MLLLQEVVLKKAKIQLFDEKFIRVEIFGKSEIGLIEAIELNETIGDLANGTLYRVLILASELSRFTKYAVDYATSEKGLSYIVGSGVVVRSVAHRVAANFYLRFNRPKKPIRIFNSEQEGIKWLSSLEVEYTNMS